VRAPSPRRIPGTLAGAGFSRTRGELPITRRPVSSISLFPIVGALTDAAVPEWPADQGYRPPSTMADSPPLQVGPRPQLATGQDASSLIQTTSVGEARLSLTPQLLPDGTRSAPTAILDPKSITHQPYTWAAGYSQAGLPSLSSQLPVPTPALPVPTVVGTHQLQVSTSAFDRYQTR